MNYAAYVNIYTPLNFVGIATLFSIVQIKYHLYGSYWLYNKQHYLDILSIAAYFKLHNISIEIYFEQTRSQVDPPEGARRPQPSPRTLSPQPSAWDGKCYLEALRVSSGNSLSPGLAEPAGAKVQNLMRNAKFHLKYIKLGSAELIESVYLTPEGLENVPRMY